MKRLAACLGFACLIVGATGVASAATTVSGGCTGSPGDWTYAFTLTNDEALAIWQWAVWFPSNPTADSVTAGTANWDVTNPATQGFFPEEYVAAWGDPVYDSAGVDLVGPNGEPGFYHTYASDFVSDNPGRLTHAIPIRRRGSRCRILATTRGGASTTAGRAPAPTS